MEVSLPDFVQRKNNRLDGYDYSQEGLYFVTICTKDNKKIFGEIVGEDSILPSTSLTPCGGVVQTTILQIPNHYPHITLDAFVVMPNHVHLLLLVNASQHGRMLSSPTISTVIGQMKRFASKKVGKSIWQVSFHDRIVRNEREYQYIWEYIQTNPLRWKEDKFYT